MTSLQEIDGFARNIGCMSNDPGGNIRTNIWSYQNRADFPLATIGFKEIYRKFSNGEFERYYYKREIKGGKTYADIMSRFRLRWKFFCRRDK